MCRLLSLRLQATTDPQKQAWSYETYPLPLRGPAPLKQVSSALGLSGKCSDVISWIHFIVGVITVMRAMRVICSLGVCAAGFLQLFSFGGAWSCVFSSDGVEKGRIALINCHISNLLRRFFIKQPQKQLGNCSSDVSFGSSWPSVCTMRRFLLRCSISKCAHSQGPTKCNRHN